MRQWIAALAAIALVHVPTPDGVRAQDDFSPTAETTVTRDGTAYDFAAFTADADFSSLDVNGPCQSCSTCGSPCATCGDCRGCCDGSRYSLRGWLNGGFIGNTSSPPSKFNGPYTAVDRSNEAMFNQGYLIAEAALPQYDRGIGGRLDLLYGEDFYLAQSTGIERRPDGSPHWNPEYYGLAIPQAYVSVGSKDANIQIGHFYSVVGYEGLMAPDNFFYSKSYSYQFAGPFTHWGAQANWNVDSAWTVQLGIHNGWDAFDRVSDDPGVIGKLRYDSPYSGAWTSFAITTGKEFNNSAGFPIQDEFTNRTRYSWLVGTPQCCRWQYVFHHWLGFQQHGAPDGGQANWYGIDQYLYYNINRDWKAGMRFEWFRDEEGTRVGLNRPSNPNVPPLPGNFFSLSFGVNWSPTDNLILRPEMRADWYSGNSVVDPYDDGNDSTQYMLGFDGIMTF
ncbi:MAG: outer membrane beta-barrel protein [Pirellulales bacterium]